MQLQFTSQSFTVHRHKMPFKTAMLLLLVSLAIFKSTRATTGSWSTAEELVRGITFGKYNERIITKASTNIKLTDFATVVSRIATRYQIPAETQGEILDGQYFEVNEQRIREFKIQKAESFLYGRTATVKREDSTIDLAFALFHPEFQLSPRRIEERRRKRFLGITYGSHFEERYLSEKEREHFIFETPVCFFTNIC